LHNEIDDNIKKKKKKKKKMGNCRRSGETHGSSSTKPYWP
jgi:hypothetical protein